MTSMRRIQKELADLNARPIPGVTIEPDEANMHNWSCSIKAAVRDTHTALIISELHQSESPYKNGTFKFKIIFPDNFPFKAPEVTFQTKIYHPGINEKGEICIPILRDQWKPSMSISTVITTIQEKVNNPSPDDPYEPEIAAELKNNKTKFLSTAKEWTKKHAT